MRYVQMQHVLPLAARHSLPRVLVWRRSPGVSRNLVAMELYVHRISLGCINRSGQGIHIANLRKYLQCGTVVSDTSTVYNIANCHSHPHRYLLYIAVISAILVRVRG